VRTKAASPVIRRRFEAECPHRDPPASADLPDDEIGGRPSTVEEQLAELFAAGGLADRLGGEARLVHGHQEVLGRWWDAHQQGLDHPMVDRRNTTRQQLNRLAHLLRRVHGELGDQTVDASGDRTFAVGDRVTARAPNRELHVEGDRHAYVRNGALGTIVDIRTHPLGRARDTLTVDFDGVGRIDVPRTFFDHHPNRGGRGEVGIDHAYALTSYAVQGSTRDVSTSRVDATATRAETYVDITRGRHENHFYITATTDPLDGEALPRLPAEPADAALAQRLQRSTGEITAWELAHPANPQAVSLGHAIGM